MRREVQEQLIGRLVELIDNDETTLVEHERLNPVSEYSDPGRLQQERSAVLHGYPIVVGHDSQLTAECPSLEDDISGTRLVLSRDGSRVRVVMHPATGAPSVEVPSEVRHGFVWAVLDPGADIDVATFLGADIDQELADFRLGDYVVERTHLFSEDLNWKSVIDGFLENYHVRFLHANTLARFLRTNVHLYDPYGVHNRLAVIKTTFDKVRHLPVHEYDPLKHMSVIYHIFPNTVVSWVGDHFESWTAFPDAKLARISNTRFTLLAPPAKAAEHSFWDRSMKTILDTIPTEDFEMARRMQRGLLANAQTHQVFGRNEGALQHFHIELENVLGRAR